MSSSDSEYDKDDPPHKEEDASESAYSSDDDGDSDYGKKRRKNASSASSGTKRPRGRPMVVKTGVPQKRKIVKKDLSKEEIDRIVLDCFTKRDPSTGEARAFWSKMDLRLTTGLPFWKFNPALTEFCVIDEDSKMYVLKPEYVPADD